MHTLTQRRTVHQGCPPTAGILLAAGVVLAAVLVQGAGGLAEALQWRRGGGTGLSWLTSHLCHWSWNHLAWDVFAFVLLSFLGLRTMPSRYASCLLVAAVLIPLEVQINQPSLDAYRGLSGIDCALLGLVVAGLWRQSTGGPKLQAPQWLAIAGGGSFLAKTLYELKTGGTLFVDAGHAPFVPVISAHLVGFVSGMVVGLARIRSAARLVLTRISLALPLWNDRLKNAVCPAPVSHGRNHSRRRLEQPGVF